MKNRRSVLGISQIALSGRADLSSGYVGELELGHKFPTAEVLERLAAALETRPYRLLMSDSDQAEVLEAAGREAFYAAASEFRRRISEEANSIFKSGSGEPD